MIYYISGDSVTSGDESGSPRVEGRWVVDGWMGDFFFNLISGERLRWLLPHIRKTTEGAGAVPRGPHTRASASLCLLGPLPPSASPAPSLAEAPAALRHRTAVASCEAATHHHPSVVQAGQRRGGLRRSPYPRQVHIHAPTGHGNGNGRPLFYICASNKLKEKRSPIIASLSCSPQAAAWS